MYALEDQKENELLEQACEKEERKKNGLGAVLE